MTADQITATATVASFVAIAIGAFLAWRAVQADHERRRKQVTIEYYTTIRTSWRDVTADVDTLIGRDVMTTDEAKRLVLSDPKSQPELFRALLALRSYLSTLEWISAGVRAGVYDIGMLYWLGSGHIMRAANRYAAYIGLVRERANRPSVYEHLDWIADQFATMHKPAPKDPKIRLS